MVSFKFITFQLGLSTLNCFIFVLLLNEIIFPGTGNVNDTVSKRKEVFIDATSQYVAGGCCERLLLPSCTARNFLQIRGNYIYFVSYITGIALYDVVKEKTVFGVVLQTANESKRFDDVVDRKTF